MPKSHEERVQICISRLQEAGLLDSTSSNAGILFKNFFDNKADPEVITKNLLYMHSKGFNFNDSDVRQQLLAGAINALEHRELFFKMGFEHKMGTWLLDNFLTLQEFYNKNINKDQSSSMYFALQVLESNGCISTATEKENAVKLLVELELHSYEYRVKEAGESYEEKSIDLLPERVAVNFIALRKEGYSGVFAQQGGGALWGGVRDGLTEKMIRVLANPLDKKELGYLAMDLSLSAMSTAFSAVSASRRGSSLAAMFLADDINNLRTSTNFIDCWKRVVDKIKFFDLVAKDNNDQLTAFLRSSAVNLTPDVLRAAYARIPKAPTSEFNRKLLLLEQGELERAESALAVGVETVDPVARNMQVLLRSNQVLAVQVNWAETLREMPLKNFSSEAIVQRTCLMAVSKLQPQEARKALGLEKLNEAQQATLIHALRENKLTIDGELNHLSELLRTASAAHGDLLIDYFLTDRNKHTFNTGNLKDLAVLTQFVHVNNAVMKKELVDRVESVISCSMQQCIPSIKDPWYSKSKDSDRIRQAWKNARAASEKTEAEQVYRSVQKERESKPANVKAVSQILSDYMTKNPTTAFSVELKKIFGDFFTQYTPSRAVAVQVSTSAAVAPAYRV